MNSKLEKLTSGLKRNPSDTLARAGRYLFTRIGSFLADLLYLFFRAQLSIAPTQTLAKLKQTVNPTVKLDYPRHSIFLHADTGLSLFRARACQKEPETVTWIEKCVKPGDVFYDVGANVGAYSLVAAAFVDKNVTIHAFEPSFSTYYQLARNIVLNQYQECIHPHLMLLSDAPGVVEFDYRSLEAGSAEHRMGSNSMSQPDGLQPVYRQRLICYSIDDLVSRYGFPVPTYIKVDVDGAEDLVLLGASKTLQDAGVKSLLVEVRVQDGQEQQIVDFLASKGFQVSSRHDRGNGIIWNYIFARIQ